MYLCTLDPELTGMIDTQFTGVSSPTPLTVTVKVDTIKMVRKKKKKEKKSRKMTNLFITYIYICTNLHI